MYPPSSQVWLRTNGAEMLATVVEPERDECGRVVYLIEIKGGGAAIAGVEPFVVPAG